MIGKKIKHFSINKYGDLFINIPYVGSIIASDDYDIRKDDRVLYKIAFIDSDEIVGVAIQEFSRRITIKKQDFCRIIPSKGECGERISFYK